MSTEVTPEERQAIAALQRLAKKWPKSLRIFYTAGGSGLSIVHTMEANEAENLHKVPVLALIGIPSVSTI